MSERLKESKMYKNNQENEKPSTLEIEKANKLAQKLAKIDGWDAQDGYRFDLDEHPRMRFYWKLAQTAMIELTGVDPEDSLLMPFQRKLKQKQKSV